MTDNISETEMLTKTLLVKTDGSCHLSGRTCQPHQVIYIKEKAEYACKMLTAKNLKMM